MNPVAAQRRTARPAGRRRARVERWLLPFLFILPAVAAIAFIFAYPLVRLARESMQQSYAGITTNVGWDNYQFVLTDSDFITAVEHNLLLLLICVPALIVCSVIFSILLYEVVRGRRFYQTVLFLPYVLAVPVVSVLFGYLLQLDGGLNTALRTLGLGFFAQDWLGSESWALPSLMGVIIWKEAGFGIMLFFARLLSLPTELWDAARVDGANWWRVHWHVTLPQLRSIIEFYAVVEGITMVSWVFSYVYVISHGTGGPGTATLVTELYVYKNAFGYGTNNLNIAAAASALLFVGAVVLMFINLRVRKVELHATH
jgi:ABC-type sugar transport system permease subunit